jgi:predicted CopG family antitoxin
MMAELKTKPTESSVSDFIDTVAEEKRRQDCRVVLDLMEAATKASPEMWGSSIVGFGRYRYKGKSGREGEWMITGFSPRKNDLTIYIMSGFEHFPDLMRRLGKYKTGKSCLYIKKLDDVDLNVLKELVEKSVEKMAEIVR